MNLFLQWSLIVPLTGLAGSIALHQTGRGDAAFWLLAAALLLAVGNLAVHYWLGQRILQWLPQGHVQQPPLGWGLWQTVAAASHTLQRKQARRTARAQEKLTALLEAIQALPMGIVLADAQGRMEWFNRIAAEHFQLNHPNDLQKPVAHLVRDPQFVQYWTQQDNNSRDGIRIYSNRSFMQQPLRLAVQFVRLDEGKRLLVSQDITAQEQTDRMRRDFVSNVSHEMRTPLTVLTGFIETLQNIPLDAGQTSHYLELMATQSQRMQVLIDDLLTLSRLEGSPSPDFNEQVQVHELLQQCVRDAAALSQALQNGHPQAAPHTISLNFAVDPKLHIMGSSTELHSAIGNLLSNAVRHSDPGSSITVQARMTAGGGLRIAVSDNGTGIADEHLLRITERFYRVDKSRSRETGGTGLGLAIVKHVAQRHGAALKIESRLGHGSCFALVFPTQRLHLQQ